MSIKFWNMNAYYEPAPIHLIALFIGHLRPVDQQTRPTSAIAVHCRVRRS
jgi:hypothetical protein